MFADDTTLRIVFVLPFALDMGPLKSRTAKDGGLCSP